MNGLFSAVSAAHGLTESERRAAAWKELKIISTCDVCGTQGPLMIDLDKLRAEITGRWEDPAKFFKQMQDRRYQRVVCKCTEGSRE